MKKFILSLLFMILGLCMALPVRADELEEDYLDIAANYCVIGDYNSALVYLDKILERNPNSKQASDLRMGLLHVISQDKKSYVTAINPGIKEAMEYKQSGNDKMEYEALLRATKANNSYIAYYFLGNYFRDRNDYMKALDAYNGSVSAKPDFAQAYLAIALTLFDVGRYEAVINPIDKYLTFDSKDDLAYAIKSRAEFELGQLEAAQADNETAIKLNNCPEYQFDKAKILYKNGNFEQAKTLFKELLPYIQTSKIYEYMGYCDLEMKDYMSALMNIDKALILSDDDLYLENKYNEIKKLLESNPNEQVQKTE